MILSQKTPFVFLITETSESNIHTMCCLTLSLELGLGFQWGAVGGMSLDPLAGGAMPAAGCSLPSDAYVLHPPCCLRCTIQHGADVQPWNFSRSCIIQEGDNWAMRPQQVGSSLGSICKGCSGRRQRVNLGAGAAKETGERHVASAAFLASAGLLAVAGNCSAKL